MREILFRGQRIDNGEWVYGQYLKREYSGFTDYSVWTPKGTIPVKPESIGQFTGLLDKNGNKIFEGDKLRDDWINDLGEIVEDYCVVTWYNSNGCWAIDNSYKKNGSSYTNLVNYLGLIHLEIIGNIHEEK